MAVFIALTFGKVFYLGATALPWFFVCLLFLGFGGANFAVYTLWLPEQYPTECRASAFASPRPLRDLAEPGSLSGWRRRSAFSIARKYRLLLPPSAFAIVALDSFLARKPAGRLCRRSLIEKAKKTWPKWRPKFSPSKRCAISATACFCISVFPSTMRPKAAEVLATADLRGIDSHGVARLHSYFDMLTLGRINPRPEIKVLRRRPAPAPSMATMASAFVSAARPIVRYGHGERFGSGWGRVQNTIIRFAGYYVLKALERDLNVGP